MSENQPTAADRSRTLRRAHRSVLGILVACAAGIALGGFDGPEPPPDRVLGSLAVALALTSIVARRLASSPVVGAGIAAAAGLLSLALIAALGLLGLYLAWSFPAPETGLLLVLGGAILALRPPAPARAR